MSSDAVAGSGSPEAPAPSSAGAMLRAAREKQGLHIAALAAAIKVAPAKLDALERDRYELLPDATFTRALAQSVCRVLKIDAKPVLERMPATGGAALEKVDTGLNQPFRDRGTAAESVEWAPWQRPVFWVVLALLVAAALFWWWPGAALKLPSLPSGMALPGRVSSPGPAPSGVVTRSPGAQTPALAGTEAAPPVATPAPPAAMPGAATAPVSETVHSAPKADAAVANPAPTDALLALSSDESSWVEVQDARGLVLFSRTLQPGETVGLNGTLPIKLKIGNAAATQLSFRGKAVDLVPLSRDNVARVELK